MTFYYQDRFKARMPFAMKDDGPRGLRCLSGGGVDLARSGLIVHALEKTNNDVPAASKILQKDKAHVHRMINNYGIDRGRIG